MNVRFAFLFFLLVLTNAARGDGGLLFAGITETTGGGAIPGLSFKNGYNLAIEEINKSGGVAGKQIKLKQYDIATDPEVAKKALAEALSEKPFVVLGPVFSGITLATLPISAVHGVPQFVGAEAASVTRQYPTNVFRTSLTQEISVPRMAAFVKQAFQVKHVTLIWVDNPFGRDGRDLFVKTIGRLGTVAVEEVMVKPGHKDFSDIVRQVKHANPDALVIYTNETEAVSILKELHKQRFDKPVIGEGPLVSQQVIDAAGEAAEGVFAHTGVSVDAPNPRILAFAQKYRERYQHPADHNSLKGYFAVYAIKVVADGMPSIDHNMLNASMKKARLDTSKQPDILVRGSYDMFGNLYRESYLVQIRNGKQFVIATIPTSEGQTIDLVNGKEVSLTTREGRKQFFALASSKS